MPTPDKIPEKDLHPEIKMVSSAGTFFAKFIFPFLFLILLAVMWFSPEQDWHGVSEQGRNLLLLLFIVFFGSFALYDSMTLKRVSLDSQNLYISNYIREIVVPISMLDGVTQSVIRKEHPITLHFKQVTEFGHRIRFVPKGGLLPWKRYLVFDEIRKRANLL